MLSAKARFANLQTELPTAACSWHRAKRNMALPAPTSPEHETCGEGGKKKKVKCPGGQQRLWRLGWRWWGAGAGLGGTRLQPAPGGSPRDGKLEARRRDSDRRSWEEEPEVAAGGSGPGEGRARGGSGRGWCREVDETPGVGEGG